MPLQPPAGGQHEGAVRDQVSSVVGTERFGYDGPPGGLGQFGYFHCHSRIGQITKQNKGSGYTRHTLSPSD